MHRCCVLGCRNKGNHIIPKDERRRQWQVAMRSKHIAATARICDAHFKPEDFITESFYTGLINTYKLLKKTVVPSVFPWTQETVVARQRRLRAENRDSTRQLSKAVAMVIPDIVEVDVAEQIEVGTETAGVSNADPLALSEPSTRDVGTYKRYQCLAAEDFMDDDDGIQYYTGLESFEKFKFVLSTLSPKAYSIKYLRSQVINVSVQDQLLITLMKLRRNKDDYELSRFFQVSQSTVPNIFIAWINFMHQMWSTLDIRPSRELIDFYMSGGIRTRFPHSRVTVDCTEIPVQRPSKPAAQQAVWNSYKNRTTAKFEDGASPRLTHSSEAYDKCENGDRGLKVQDNFASKGVTLNIPVLVKSKSQIPGLTVMKDMKLAAKRSHIERKISLTKTYLFLQEPVHIMYVPLMSKIYFVCEMLANFKVSQSL